MTQQKIPTTPTTATAAITTTRATTATATAGIEAKFSRSSFDDCYNRNAFKLFKDKIQSNYLK